ncbi:hypothetical protein AVL57_12435 [Alteromonas stellipolaris]|uniref:Uncharacterized protein n=2 Tax=Alteromonas stellipolaris TaxID=233316 RepID=A0ABN4LRU6_9ALTE|nr:hypothetical protein AVL57_12435 [Alteromonas stellipolaris]
MPRKMSREKELEFEELSLFLEFYSTNVSGIQREDPIHPSNCLVEIVNKFGKSKALQGLKQAINDTLEDTASWDSNTVSELDEQLRDNGTITLSTLRTRYWSKYKSILKRGKIKNETEYYLIRGLECELDNGIPQEQRTLLAELVRDFEERV